MGVSVEENLKGESRFIAAISWAATDLKPYESVLDVGCGYGRIAACFCDSGYHYTGIDVAPVAIDGARKHEPRGQFILGSALKIELEQKYDLICALYVLVHFVEFGDWRALLKILSEHLVTGGSLFLADQFPDVEQRPSKHVFQRPLTKHVAVLEELGLGRDADFKERLEKSWTFGGSPPPFELFRG